MAKGLRGEKSTRNLCKSGPNSKSFVHFLSLAADGEESRKSRITRGGTREQPILHAVLACGYLDVIRHFWRILQFNTTHFSNPYKY